MHAASIDNSPRLRRAFAVLSDGTEYSTLDLVRLAHVCAVNSVVSELRANGLNIRCQRKGQFYYYRYIPDNENSPAAAAVA